MIDASASPGESDEDTSDTLEPPRAMRGLLLAIPLAAVLWGGLAIIIRLIVGWLVGA